MAAIGRQVDSLWVQDEENIIGCGRCIENECLGTVCSLGEGCFEKNDQVKACLGRLKKGC